MEADLFNFKHLHSLFVILSTSLCVQVSPHLEGVYFIFVVVVDDDESLIIAGSMRVRENGSDICCAFMAYHMRICI